MKTFEAELCLDLHGLTPTEALRRTRAMLESEENSGKTLMVIHGKGLHNATEQGKLRGLVRELGGKSRRVKRVWNGETVGLRGGSGVTVFFL